MNNQYDDDEEDCLIPSKKKNSESKYSMSIH